MHQKYLQLIWVQQSSVFLGCWDDSTLGPAVNARYIKGIVNHRKLASAPHRNWKQRIDFFLLRLACTHLWINVEGFDQPFPRNFRITARHL
jgi:hypothetical protein